MSLDSINAHFFPPKDTDTDSFSGHDSNAKKEWILSLQKGDRVVLASGHRHSNSSTFTYASVARKSKTLIVFKTDNQNSEYRFKIPKMSFKGDTWDSSIVEIYPIGDVSNALIKTVKVVRGAMKSAGILRDAFYSKTDADIIALAMKDEKFVKELTALTKKAEALTLKYFPKED